MFSVIYGNSAFSSALAMVDKSDMDFGQCFANVVVRLVLK